MNSEIIKCNNKSDNDEPEKLRSNSEIAKCSDKSNISSIDNISNFLDSDLITYLNEECNSSSLLISDTILDSVSATEKQIYCSPNESKNMLDNKLTDPGKDNSFLVNIKRFKNDSFLINTSNFKVLFIFYYISCYIYYIYYISC